MKTLARAGVPCQRTPAHSEQASRAQAAGIVDKPWYAADNHHNAGIPMSAASRHISGLAGVLCQQPPARSEWVLLSTSSLIPIDRNTVTTSPPAEPTVCLSCMQGPCALYCIRCKNMEITDYIIMFSWPLVIVWATFYSTTTDDNNNNKDDNNNNKDGNNNN